MIKHVKVIGTEREMHCINEARSHLTFWCNVPYLLTLWLIVTLLFELLLLFYKDVQIIKWWSISSPYIMLLRFYKIKISSFNFFFCGGGTIFLMYRGFCARFCSLIAEDKLFLHVWFLYGQNIDNLCATPLTRSESKINTHTLVPTQWQSNWMFYNPIQIGCARKQASQQKEEALLWPGVFDECVARVCVLK